MANHLTERLAPLAGRALSTPLPQGFGADEHQIRVLIALVRSKRAQLGRLVFSPEAPTGVLEPDVQHGLLWAPTALGEFLRKNARDLEGADIKEIGARVEQQRQAIHRCIEAEAALYHGKNREVGLGVDVAVVDARGARFV